MIHDRMLFGRFLIEKRKINQAILDKALEKQSSEKISDKPRMLGSILLHDFNVFTNRIELQRYLKEFEQYKEQIEEMYEEAKKYGIDPYEKLEMEYADLMEELETNETISVRSLIRKLENVRIEIKNGRSTEELEKEKEKSAQLLQDKNNFYHKIQRQDILIKSLTNDKISLQKKNNKLQKLLKQYYDEYGDISQEEKLPKLKKL